MRNPNHAGFSLVELATVLMVISLAAAVGAPAVTGYFRSNEMERSVSQFSAHLDLARHRSIAQNNPYEVLLGDPAANQIRIHDDDDGDGSVDEGETVLGPYDLPGGIAFTDVALNGDGRLVFRPSGMLDAGQGGTVLLADGHGNEVRIEIFGSGSVSRVED